MLGTHSIPLDQQRSLTRDARSLLAAKIGQKKAKELIRLVSADQLQSLSTLGDFDALLVAFGNHCPYCHALKQTLSETAQKLAKRKQKAPVHILLFETSTDANREFASQKLRNKYVPAFFLVRARNGLVWLEEWQNSDQIGTSIDGNGQLTKSLPFETLLEDLKQSPVSAKTVSRETMQTFQAASEARHQAKLAQLKL